MVEGCVRVEVAQAELTEAEMVEPTLPAEVEMAEQRIRAAEVEVQADPVQEGMVAVEPADPPRHFR